MKVEHREPWREREREREREKGRTRELNIQQPGVQTC